MNSLCLERLLLSVSATSAEFHEDLRSTVTAVDSVSLTVKAFVGATKRTLVVYKFRHSQTDRPVRVRVMKGVSVGLGGFEASPST